MCVSWGWGRGFWQENDAGPAIWPEDGEWGPRVTEGQRGAGSLVPGVTLREARKIPSPYLAISPVYSYLPM